MSDFHYAIEAEPDTLHKNRLRVAIYRVGAHGKRDLVGVPLRNSPEAVVEAFLRPIRYAFEFGLDEMRGQAVHVVSNLPKRVSNP